MLLLTIDAVLSDPEGGASSKKCSDGRLAIANMRTIRNPMIDAMTIHCVRAIIVNFIERRKKVMVIVHLHRHLF
jgi:hypothetical protein